MQPLRSFLFAPGNHAWSTIALPEPCRRAGLWPIRRPTKPYLWAGVQNRTALADIAVKCSEKTARGPTIATEILALRVADREKTAKTVADPGCCPR